MKQNKTNQQITIGQFNLTKINDSKIHITINNTPEGGIFNISQLEKYIKNFYNKNF